ncbi:MAG: hypothetical protein ACXABJ_07545 [Candidatus Heimdallarchaeaceae archaeon]
MKKVDIMKKQTRKITLFTGVLVISFLIYSSSLNAVLTNAILDKTNSQSGIESFDRFSWEWSTTPYIVSFEGSIGAYNPTLVVDSENKAHIVWVDSENYTGDEIGTDVDIVYKRWNSEFTNWEPPELISIGSTEHSQNPSIAVDVGGNVHIVWDDPTPLESSGTDYDIFYRRWDASSSTWSKITVISDVSNTFSFSPSIATDHLGNVHIVWYDRENYDGSGTDNDIFYRQWNNLTSTWSTTEVVSLNCDGHSELPSIAIDKNGHVHVTWHDDTDWSGSGTDDDILYRRRWAHLSSWTGIAVVSSDSNETSWYPSIAVDAADNVHIAWLDATNFSYSGTDTDIFYNSWDSALLSWKGTEVVSPESDSFSLYPSLAVDSSGIVHVAWEDQSDYQFSGTDKDIFYKQRDPSSLWTMTEIVTRYSINDSELPSLAVDETGVVHLTYSDQTNFGFGTDEDIYYKQFNGPPLAPNLAYIVPNPTDLDTVMLDWNAVGWQTLFHVYRSNSYIYSIKDLEPITSTYNTFYIDNLPSVGFYYYVIVAENFVGESLPSNCRLIEYSVPSMQEFVIVSSLIAASAILVFVFARLRKKIIKKN